MGLIIEEPLRAHAEVEPRIILPFQGAHSFALTLAEAADIAKFLCAPVLQSVHGVSIQQETRDGWDRIVKEVDFALVASGTKMVFVSARRNWVTSEKGLLVYDRAYILDGALYLEYLLSSKTVTKIPICVVFGKSEEEEGRIRQLITTSANFSFKDVRHSVGTNTPRIVIDQIPKILEIVSEPFVIDTAFGYAAAISVIEHGARFTSHLILGAKSITTELEMVRKRNGCLTGCRVEIRKTGSDRTAPFAVKIL